MMRDSRIAFVGTIPHYYDEYLGPLIFEAYAMDLARRLCAPHGGAVLELAAGTGYATRHLRRALPQDVRLVATDLNQPMLEIAKRKFDSLDNVEFQLADAGRLSYSDGVFDAAACQFSLMFFPDKLAALREVARILKPGGTFVFSTWDSLEHNHIIRTINATLVSLFPEDPPPFFHTPYGYHRIDEVKTLLLAAGFNQIDIAVLPKVSQSDTARQAAVGFVLGTPVRHQISERGKLAAEEVARIAERALSETYGQAPIRAKMQALVFSARLGADP
jgi:SAM-dependent methyltransferase